MPTGDDTTRNSAARNVRVEDWLSRGGVVLAASDRAARRLTTHFHEARLREGLRAWGTPAVFAWDRWVENEWTARSKDGRMLLQPLQERAVWMRAIGRSRDGEAIFRKRRLAGMAQQAYRLLCAYASESLAIGARRGWANDAAVFSEWLDEFEKLCREEEAMSASRLTLELAALLRRERRTDTNPPLLLIGFDRVTPAQEALLQAWGEWKADRSELAGGVRYIAARDGEAELDACVGWIRERLEESSAARLMVIVPNLAERRGELERALRAESQSAKSVDFEFSLGVPLQRMSVARSAALLLRWLSKPISEAELDWLLGSGHLASSVEEETGLQSVMLEMQRREWGRPEWWLKEFLAAAERWAGRGDSSNAMAAVRTLRLRVDGIQAKLEAGLLKLSPPMWAAEARQSLEMLGWPGFRPLASVAYQARERWERVLEDCGALGFDGSRMMWSEFADAVEDACNEAVFAAESEAPRVVVTEPLESAGQVADGVWFLAANERSWPAQGQPHPLLPVGLQRSSGMPHASLRGDWELAERVTARLLASANTAVFSYARQDGEVEARPSRIVLDVAGECVELEPNTGGLVARTDKTETFEDRSLPPFLDTDLSGGARSLTLQSLCPFQAFGVVRLHAEETRRSGPALTPSQRGLLLHAVMRKVWGGRNAGGVSNLEGLIAVRDLHEFASGMVAAAMRDAFDSKRPNAFPDRYPRHYLKLESEHLTRLVCEWLEYERTRLPFEIAGTEKGSEVTLAGLKLNVRLDRIDVLPDGSRLIVDYKTGLVNPKDWDGERPEDVQLPLYASFAVPEELEGLVFAQMARGDMRFKGRVRNAAANLIPTLKGNSGLVKGKLTQEQLDEWKWRIEKLAKDFVDGRAEVDPKDVGKTCARCHLHAVCRIYENLPEAAWQETDENDFAEEGDADE